MPSRELLRQAEAVLVEEGLHGGHEGHAMPRQLSGAYPQQPYRRMTGGKVPFNVDMREETATSRPVHKKEGHDSSGLEGPACVDTISPGYSISATRRAGGVGDKVGSHATAGVARFGPDWSRRIEVLQMSN